jgi:hypothetical protein
MTSNHSDPEDRDAENLADESSEMRMRQALERLSGDRSTAERHGGSDRPFAERQPLDRSHAPSRPQPAAQPSFGSGSFSSAGPRRHRYVQDGEVPVVQISTLRDRRREPGAATSSTEPQVDVGRAALGLERAARLRAEQALERAQATVHGLETRLGHAEITQREAVEQARAHERRCVSLQAELAQQADQLSTVEQQLADALRRQDELREELAEAREEVKKAKAAKVSAARAPVEPARVERVAAERPRLERTAKPRVVKSVAPVVEVDEPEPVKWWLTPPSKSKARKSA